MSHASRYGVHLFGHSQRRADHEDGKSDYYLEGEHKSVREYFGSQHGTVSGAIVVNSSTVFLGPYFFSATNLGRALMSMHEAVHLAGKGDADFGGSKQLSALIVDNCFTAVEKKSLVAFLP